MGLFIVILGCFLEKGVVVLGNLRLDEGDFLLGQPVTLVEFRVSPLLVKGKVGDESINAARGVLC